MRGVNMAQYQLIATCASGLEALVGQELRALGFETAVENGRVRFFGDEKAIATANYWLRTADRIKIVVAEFEAKTFDSLFEGVKALDWEDYLFMDSAFPIRGRAKNSQLMSVSDIQAITKKAIVDKLATIFHKRGRLPETGAEFPIETAINKDQVLVTIDTTGPSLFKRGYRIEKGSAPLKENMAAALIMLTNWTPDKPFVDPVCGSGTIPIEAALIGQNIAPGFNRNFLFESWPWFDNKYLDEVKNEAEEVADYDIELDITGSDIDHRMVDIAIKNATEAGLSDSINFKQMQLADFTTEKENGIIVANPPYGERLDDDEQVLKLYEDMGKVFRPHTTWSKYILTSHLDFEQYYGEKATKKRKLYNGALRTDYFQFWGKH